jgi:predicted ArsR family transcriptional regulator
MPATPSDARFFASTRGQLVLLLRRGPRSVEELARALGLTLNGVRAHLATLERDGLVRQQGVRRGAGKPAYLYGLLPAADELFPKAYAPVLGQLLSVLARRLPPPELEAVLHQVGRDLAAEHAQRGDDFDGRLRRALDVWADLGGLADPEQTDDGLLIRGYTCPLPAVVPAHPDLCRMAATLVSELIQAPVRERCDRGRPPRCRFEVTLPGKSGVATGQGPG